MRAIRTTTTSILALGLLAGSAVGVAAQDEATAPEPFTGLISCGGQIAVGASEMLEFPMGEASMTIVTERGNTWRPTAFDMSDPRFEGRYSISFDNDIYNTPGAAGSAEIGAGTWRIENDEGAWQGSYHIFDTPLDGESVTVTVPLVGEGAYEGLSAIVESSWRGQCGWSWRGLIVEGELPGYPEPPAE